MCFCRRDWVGVSQGRRLQRTSWAWATPLHLEPSNSWGWFHRCARHIWIAKKNSMSFDSKPILQQLRSAYWSDRELGKSRAALMHFIEGSDKYYLLLGACKSNMNICDPQILLHRSMAEAHASRSQRISYRTAAFWTSRGMRWVGTGWGKKAVENHFTNSFTHYLHQTHQGINTAATECSNFT